MHELALSTAIVDIVAKHARGRRVSAVSLRVGALRQVVPDSLDFCFQIVARDTVCADARLEQELIPVGLCCRPCGRRWEAEYPAFRCPACSSADVEVHSGEELEVESIEVEEESCIASR